MTSNIPESFQATINGISINYNQTFEVINPFNGESFATAPHCSLNDLDNAVLAARDALSGWTDLPWSKRQEYLSKCAKILLEHKDILAKLLTMEQGKSLSQADMEILITYQWMNTAASYSDPTNVFLANEDIIIKKQYKPIGVVACIIPWNFPVLLMHMKIAHALLAGCTVVVKPSEYTPLCNLEIARLYNLILPPGIFNCISNSDKEFGRRLVEHTGIDKISFTGSTETGKKVVRSSANSLKRITAELGGNDPAIVLPDCDPAKVAKEMFPSIFVNSGQICIGIKRIFVHESIYDAYCKALGVMAKSMRVGDGMELDVFLGPLNNEMQYTKVRDTLIDAIDKGATVVHGEIPAPASSNKGFLFPPVVLKDVKEGFRVVDEEQFGPLAPVLSYNSIEEAIRRANDTEYGLGASVWTSDVNRGAKVAEQLLAGTVWVNDHASILTADTPFGGIKHSGIGLEGGIEGLLSFMNLSVVKINKKTAQFAANL